MAKTKVLILGGTGEARELASRAVELFADSAEIISSQAGLTEGPEPLPGRVIRGGFGGITGLQDFIEAEHISLVIDATHPFAETISDNAYIACMASGVVRMMLVRPTWKLPDNDSWIEVTDMEEAAVVLGKMASRVFVTTGRRGLEAFSQLSELWFLVRMIEQPTEPLPLQNFQILTARPPFDLASERALLKSHKIDALLAKNSGGPATEAKIIAALEAEIPVVLLRRPEQLPGVYVDSVDECLQWLQTHI